jgi:hypothetical protein
MVLALGLTSAVYAATAARPATDQNPTENSAPAPASVPAPVNIPDSAYPYPANAIFVAPGGNDAGAGTIGDPYATVAHAIAASPSGGTIVLRAGVYREALGAITKPLTLQSYPHEQAWLSGTVVVNGWTPAPGGNAWAHTGWTAQFCQTCFDPNAIVAAYPTAGLPDMVFINGRPLAQVTSLAAVGPGTFFVDYSAQTLYVGDDPTAAGTTVEAAAQSQAAMFNPGAAGSVVRGIGFEEYASAYNPWPNPAMVVDNAAPNIDFERDAFVRSASRGLTVYASGVSVTDSVFVDNGMVGLHANAADHLDVERNLVARNNNEHFIATNSSITSTAGIKITSTGWATIKNNVIEDNYANGIWCDLSCHDLQIVDNLARRNNQNGIFVEISGLALVASNVSVQNGLDGVRLSGTTDTRSYNNTLADNGAHALGVYDDGRRNTDPVTLALGVTWQPARNVVYNNLLATSASAVTGPLLLTQDNDRPMVDDAASMITGLDSNVYARANSSAPTTLVQWIHGAKKAAGNFATLGTLQSGTGDETSGLELTGPGAAPLFDNLASGDYSLASGSPAAGSGAPLPSDVARAIGTAALGAVDRGELLGPPSAPSATTTTVTAPAAQLPAPATVTVVVANASPVALAPSGAVTLVDTTTGTTIGSASLDGTGTATFSAASFNQGSHDLSVQYGGDRDNQASGGAATLAVSAAVSTTSISADVAQPVFGQTVTLTAHVDASVNPTGTVTFSDAGAPIGTVPLDADGDAVFADSAMALGSHAVSASYGGDAQTAPSTDTDDADLTVGTASTAPSLVATPAVPEIGEMVTLHTTVGAIAPGAGVPTGSVSFFDGTTKIADVALDGSGAADTQIAALSAGAHSFTVAYAGDGNFAGATSDPLSLTAVARRATTALSASTQSAVFGQSITLNAQVSDDEGAVTDGAVTFTDTTTSQVLGVAALDTNGNASVSTSALALGDHAIAASFGGNTDGDSASTASTTVTVAPATVTIDAQVNPASVTAGGSVHVHASVAAAAPGAGTPSGIVHVDDTTTGTHLADLTLDDSGVVDGDVAAGAPGGHTLTLAYSGDDDFGAGATTAGYGVVAAATTTITSVDMANPSFGQTVTLQAAVSGGARTPTGTVQFSDGANLIGTASLDGTGTATLATSALVTGPHTIVASYGGNANSTASDSSAAPLIVEVGQAPTQTALTADVATPAHGQLVTFSIAVTGAQPSGTVMLLDGTTPITAALPLDSNGDATVATASLAVGTHVLIAAYGGDANHAASDSSVAPVTVVVSRATTTTSLVASANSAALGAPVTLSATVSIASPGQGVPTGTVTFADKGVALSAPIAVDGSGTARLVSTTLPLGVRGLTAAYAGDTSNGSSTSASVAVTISRRSPTVSIATSTGTAVSGQGVTFTASVSDANGVVPDGSVAFSDASKAPATVLATVPVVAGHASFTTASLAPGAHTITARYLGGANDMAAGPASVTQTVTRAASATALVATPPTSSLGAPVTLTASVSVQAPGQASPTGTVTFLDAGKALGTAVALGPSAQAVFLTSALHSGAHTLTAVYNGNATISASTSAVVPATVGLRPTTVASASPSATSVFGQTVAVAVMVADPLGAVTRGSVVFKDTIGGTTTTLGTVTPDGSGNAKLSVTFRRVGAHSISARYLGNGTDAASAPATLVQTVTRASTALALRVTPVSVVSGATVTVAIAASAVAPGTGIPAGAFSVYDGTTLVKSGSLVATTGAQTVVIKPLAALGAHSITVTTAGNANFLPARSSPVTMTVKKKT